MITGVRDDDPFGEARRRAVVVEAANPDHGVQLVAEDVDRARLLALFANNQLSARGVRVDSYVMPWRRNETTSPRTNWTGGTWSSADTGMTSGSAFGVYPRVHH